MHSLYYISFGIALLTSGKKDSNNLFEDYLTETTEVCSTEGALMPAIATCKFDNPSLSFEDKVRLCTIKMRPTVMPHILK
jgi:hypothetical protein